MDPLKFIFYVEAFSISLGVVNIISVLPLQALLLREIRWLSVFTTLILWYTIIFHNNTFWELIDKWFKR